MRSPGPRPPAGQPPEGASEAAGPANAPGGAGGAGTGPESTSSAAGTRPGSRAANRAAKRAAAGPVRPKTTRSGGGRRSSRGSSTGLILLGAIAVVIVAVAVIVLGNPFGTPTATPSSSPVAQATPAASHGDGTCPTSQPASLKAGEAYDVTITTKLGDIVMRIDGALAPIATGNFVALVKCHFYDGIVFHRLMPGFVIQGGDPAGNGSGGPGYSIQDDPITTTYQRGTVAMARTPAPNSQGSQFFIVLSDDADQSLSGVQYGYAILGEVIQGMDVVDQIATGPNTGGNEGTALDPVVMESVTLTPVTPTAAPATTAPASTEPSAAPAS